MYCKMVIGEAISPDQVSDLRSIFREEALPEITNQAGNVGANIMVEEGGSMLIFMTIWKQREDCLRYHSSRTYRQFVARTQALLIGSYVVKIFKMEGP
jgi:quinol monooxygenase YgiN